MNGKLARALRRSTHNGANATNLDAQRSIRYYAHQYDVSQNTPKPLVQRVRKPAESFGPSAKIRLHGPIVQHPMRFIRKHITETHTSLRILSGARSYRDANAFPKHVLDRLALN